MKSARLLPCAHAAMSIFADNPTGKRSTMISGNRCAIGLHLPRMHLGYESRSSESFPDCRAQRVPKLQNLIFGTEKLSGIFLVAFATNKLGGMFLARPTNGTVIHGNRMAPG
jgi:hypothetical protein